MNVYPIIPKRGAFAETPEAIARQERARKIAKAINDRKQQSAGRCAGGRCPGGA